MLAAHNKLLVHLVEERPLLGRHDHRLHLGDELLAVGRFSKATARRFLFYDWLRRGIAATALAVRVPAGRALCLQCPRVLVAVEVAPYVLESLAVVGVDEDEDERMEDAGQIHDTVQRQLGLRGAPHGRHAAHRVAFVTELVAQHLHQLVDVVGRPGADEDKDVEEEGDGGPAVRGLQSWCSPATHLHNAHVDVVQNNYIAARIGGHYLEE